MSRIDPAFNPYTGGFTLIEVLIAVLVLALALGASLNALGNYVGFQARLGERYTAHGIAWNALMRCHIASVQKGRGGEGETTCELSKIEKQSGTDWSWSIESDEVDGWIVFYEIKVSPASRDDVVGHLKAWMREPL